MNDRGKIRLSTNIPVDLSIGVLDIVRLKNSPYRQRDLYKMRQHILDEDLFWVKRLPSERQPP